MGIFSNVNTASGTLGGLYLRPGNFIAKIDKVTFKKSRKNIDLFIVDLEILESDNPEMPVGSKPSYLVTMDKDPALGNIADFARAALACAQAQFDGELVEDFSSIELSEAIMEQIYGEENVLVGTEIAVYAFIKPTKSGADFTHVRWSVPNKLVTKLRKKSA